MIQLKRSECAVLPLVLKGKWYDMIASGEKKVARCYFVTKLSQEKHIFFANKAFFLKMLILQK